ncbi:MAG: hypothetical protein IKH98_04910 [Candidatus Methanomethylophilaceae archaeon]|nr:hypothetical protein [Candidatus Methanomethylophilaceae archaeon]
MSLAMSFIRDHISVCHGATAPSSIVFDSSGTRESSSTSYAIPVPSQFLHAPVLLNARSSALGGETSAPQTGHLISIMAAKSMLGSR